MDEKDYIDAVERQDAGIADYDYQVYDMKDAFKPQEPMEWLVEDIIEKDTITVFFGEPGAKKTYSVISLAVCAALGKPWLDKKTTQTKVLFIDEETRPDALRRRLRKCVLGEIGTDEAEIQYVCLAGFLLDKKEDVIELENLINKSGAGLVIFDALANIMSGDENSKKDTQPVFNALKRIAFRTGCTIIVIHHSGKSGIYRGSSVIKASIDQLIKVESKPESEWITFTPEKAREFKPVKLVANIHFSEDQVSLTPAEGSELIDKEPNKGQRYVIGYLKEHGASELPTIEASADMCSAKSANIAVYALVDQGIIKRTNKGESGRGVKAIYDLVKEDDWLEKI